MTTAAIAFWSAAGLLLYVYVLYPGLMWLAARLPVRNHQPLAEAPRVSVIVPAHNEAPVLDNKIRNLLALVYPPERLEIIVASDGSTDETVEIARSYERPNLHVLDLNRGGKASALNAAAAVATGEVLCLCDANVFFRPDALRRMVERLASADVGAVTGDVRLASDESDFGAGESLFYRVEREIQRGESRIGSAIGVDGGMYVVRRDLYRPISPDTILDDFVISMAVIRQGFRVSYEAAAVATESGTPSSQAEFRRRARVAAGSVQSLKRAVWPPLSRPLELWQYASHKLLRWLGPYLMLVLLAANVVLAHLDSVYAATLIVQSAVYALAVGAAVSTSFRWTRLGGIPFYFLLSHVAMVVGQARGLFDRQPAAWERTERTSSTASLPGPQTRLAREERS